MSSAGPPGPDDRAARRDVINGLDVQQLRVFDAVMRHRNVTRAGEHLNLSQPAVSGALARLRLALSDELFTRKHGGMEPTRTALALASPVAQLLQQITSIASFNQPFEPSWTTRAFQIMSADYFSILFGPAMVELAAAEAPNCVLHMTDDARTPLADALREGRIDLVLDQHQAAPDWVNSAPLLSEHLVAVVAPGNPALSGLGFMPGDMLPIDVLCAVPNVMRSTFGVSQGRMDVALSAVGRQRRILATSSHFIAIGAMVARTRMLAMVPARIAPVLEQFWSLETYVLPPELGPQTHHVAMYWNHRHDDDDAHRWLRSIVQRVSVAVGGAQPPS